MMVTNLKRTIPYRPFNQFVFRTPFYSFQRYIETLKLLPGDHSYWDKLFHDNYLLEGIIVASPALFKEIRECSLKNNIVDFRLHKLRMALLRYYTRMSTRCTPFGLFAGVSVGRWSNESLFRLANKSKFTRCARLDMDYLCSLLKYYSDLPQNKKYLKFFPNSTIYEVNNRLRYVEFYSFGIKRIHQISEVDNSIPIQNVLEIASKGATIEDLAGSLVNEEISISDSTEYIYELIENQILVSELEPTITGGDLLNQLIEVINDLPDQIEHKNKIKHLHNLIERLNNTEIGSSNSFYDDIEEAIKFFELDYDPKYLIQTDLFKPTIASTLDVNILNDLLDSFLLLNKITSPQKNQLLNKFIENFVSRYEEREMPLLEVLDSEIGIGYNFNSHDNSALLKKYQLPLIQGKTIDTKWNNVLDILYNKLLDAYKNNKFCIEIRESDFKFNNPNWNDTPLTVSIMCKILEHTEDYNLIYIKSISGASATNLLTRFCHLDDRVESLAREICNYEQNTNQDIIYAEIVYLPESRAGNILQRPNLRQFEIPFLAKSSVEYENQISLADILISVKNNRVILRSKKLDKVIIPRLSSAHNYAYNTMPVYHFLCDLQSQDERTGFMFSWGILENEYDFLPRVQFKNVILSLAKWKIQTSDFLSALGLNLENNLNKKKAGLIDEMALMENLSRWRISKNVPRFVVFSEGDNELLIDMDNIICTQMLLSIIRQHTSFILKEFPFNYEKAIIKDDKEEAYTNEFVFGFHKIS